MSAKVAIIIPTYNRWPSVCDAIDSVLSQTYSNIECIVVDDASQDGTAEKLIQKYADTITVLLNPTNKGQSFSRNHGVEKTSASYVGFLDSDDVFTADAIKSRMRIYELDADFQGCVFGLCVSEKEGDTKKFLSKKKAGETLSISEYIENKSWIRNNSYIIPSDTMKNIGLYNESLYNKEDIELFLRLLSQREFRFSGSIVCLVRELGGDRARDNFSRIIQQWDQFYLTIADNPSITRKLTPQQLSKLQVSDIMEPLRGLYKTGQYTEFRKAYKDILKEKTIILNKRYKKRYLFSYVLQLFKP